MELIIVQNVEEYEYKFLDIEYTLLSKKCEDIYFSTSVLESSVFSVMRIVGPTGKTSQTTINAWLN